ncbi:MAG: DUF3987 domain-containing protein [Bacteroidaceae bacterium]|nr:DUF3987 domain-containing protein [Bacteroidaceae bacterium]
MSVHLIYYKDGAKMMMPVLSKEEYLAIRNGGEQRERVKRIRSGEESLKHKLVQMNYSCLPNEDGTLKGSTRMSNTVGMDIDWTPSPLPREGEEQLAARKEEWLQKVPELVLSKKDELGLMMLEKSATKGYHLVFRRRPELSQEENLRWASDLLGVKFDENAKDITRVFFTTTGSQLLFLSPQLFELKEEKSEKNAAAVSHENEVLPQRGSGEGASFPTSYHGIPFTDIIRKYWELNNHGYEPTQGDRDTLTYQLACDLRHICGKNFDWLDQVIPCYDGFPLEEKRAKIKSALASEYNGFPTRLRNVLNSLQMEDGRGKMEDADQASDIEEDDAAANSSFFTLHSSFKKLPQGIRESIEAVGPQLAMPVVTAICPCIGTLATGVTLDVHGKKKGLNLISYIAGDFASGKGSIDPVVEAWMSEVLALDKMYQQQEDEWRAKKRAAKNKKEQPEEPKLPVRCLTLNNTVANLAERLANTEGKHAFSFTPEADTVAQKWKSTMSDFSVMLRQSYDGSKYEREARSADAVNVHIEKLLWNVCMCGTPDALYRVVSNYTDGFQSRIAVARTPDNTFAPLEDNPHVLTDRQRDRIQQIAHLLPLMHGEVVLPKLEARGREWLEKIRLETMKNDDRTRARQRFRICVTAQRMVCCLMLCKVCEMLIQKHGLTGAEAKLKQQPNLWKEMLLKAQTPTMLEVYDVIADSLLENALYFFRDRIENAFQSRDYAGGLNGERQKRGKNDSIFERLDPQFTFEQAMQHSVAVKGANVNHNTVRQMLKNWRKQGLVMLEEDGKYRKK